MSINVLEQNICIHMLTIVICEQIGKESVRIRWFYYKLSINLFIVHVFLFLKIYVVTDLSMSNSKYIYRHIILLFSFPLSQLHSTLTSNRDSIRS